MSAGSRLRSGCPRRCRWGGSLGAWRRVAFSYSQFGLDAFPPRLYGEAICLQYIRLQQLFEVLCYQHLFGFEASLPDMGLGMRKGWPSWRHWCARLGSSRPWHVRWRASAPLSAELKRYAAALQSLAVLVAALGISEDRLFRELLFFSITLFDAAHTQFPIPPRVDDIPGYRSVAVAEWEHSPFEDYVLSLPPGCRRLQTFSRTWRPAPRVEWEHRIVLDVCTRVQVCSRCGLACLLLLPELWWCSCCC